MRRKKLDEKPRLTGISRGDTIFATVLTVGMLIAALYRFHFMGVYEQYLHPMKVF